jgi:hypothetical protein
MRFLVMVKATTASEAGQLPTKEELLKMGAFNETLVRDGVMLAAEGLRPSNNGARISYAGGRPSVTDGPFAESKELVAGFWLLQARSKEEIVERLKQAPFQRGEQIEIRQLFEAEDLAEVLA